MGIETKYAREIATQPAIAFVVFIGTIRQFLSSGLRQLVNTELALKGIPPERWAYRFVFPQISLNPYQQVIDLDVDQPGVSEVEQ